MHNRRDVLVLLAIVAATSYFFVPRDALSPVLLAGLKGAGVGLLALWALRRASNPAGRLIALVLACGAAGDVLIETMGFVAGGIAFLAGHVAAIMLYWRNRSTTLERTMPVMLTIAVVA